MNISKEGLMTFAGITNLLEYRTLMCILANTSEDGSCYMKQDDIARDINTHRQAVNKSIKQLSDKNILSIEKVGLNRIYHLNPDYCITALGYKELYKRFNNFKDKILEEK